MEKKDRMTPFEKLVEEKLLQMAAYPDKVTDRDIQIVSLAIDFIKAIKD